MCIIFLDWYKLRTEHRIMGSFDGALSDNQSNGNHSQVPVRLSNPETQLLVKTGIARTVECPKLHAFDAPVTLERFLALRKERVNEQVSA